MKTTVCQNGVRVYSTGLPVKNLKTITLLGEDYYGCYYVSLILNGQIPAKQTSPPTPNRQSFSMGR